MAGVRLGDIILKIDEYDLRDFDSRQDVEFPEGPAGMVSKWLVQRRGSAQPETIEVTRAVIANYPHFGSLELPIPAGVAGWLVPVRRNEATGNWIVKVVSVVPNATDTILSASNEYATPPREGMQYFMATIHAEYIGVGSDTLRPNWYFNALGDATKVFYETGCGNYSTTTPNALPVVEVIPGAMLNGNICWEIDSRDAPTLKMRLERNIQYQGEDYLQTVWYNLSPSSPWHTAPTPAFGSGGSN